MLSYISLKVYTNFGTLPEKIYIFSIVYLTGSSSNIHHSNLRQNELVCLILEIIPSRLSFIYFHRLLWYYDLN